MAEIKQFERVAEFTEETPDAGTRVLLLALKALSQRAIAALADLFMLATVGSAFVLWYLTPRPDIYQIVSLSIYSAFILAANWIVRGRRA